MAVSQQSVGSEIGKDGLSSDQFSKQVRDFLGKFGRNVKTASLSAHRSLQSARMMSTLSSMSDYQLSQIGITRAEIPQYAERLMSVD